MAIDLQHDKEAGVVWLRASGALTYQDFGTIKWPEMAPGTLEVFDVRDVATFPLSSDQIAAIARSEAREDVPVSRMAIVTGHDVAYGLGRMFEQLAEDVSYEVTVFRDMDDALAWLGIDDPA